MEQIGIRNRLLCPLVEGDSRAIGVHRRWVPQPMDRGISFIDNPRPSLRANSRACGECHGSSRPGRPVFAETKKRDICCQLEHDQSGVFASAVDSTGALEEFSKAGRSSVRGVVDFSILVTGRGQIVVKASRRNGAVGPEGVPRRRITARTKVHPPKSCTCWQNMDVRRECPELTRRRRIGKFGHRA